ncbi:hypothetical protein JXI42_01480 [bacterium]|nr:hypothetical protein [bacterium]
MKNAILISIFACVILIPVMLFSGESLVLKKDDFESRFLYAQSDMPEQRTVTSSFLAPFSSSFQSTNEKGIFEEEFEEEGGTRKKKTSRALLLSLLLPGAGEYYLGAKNNAKLFWIAEGAIWTTFIGFQIYGTWEEDRYKSWAVDHAGINPNGKDKDYFQNISIYNDIEEYNYWTYLLERNQDELYPETPYWYWKWNSNDDRLYYKDLRHNAEKSFRNSNIMIGFAVLNRLLSGINVLRISRFQDESETILSLKLNLENQPNGQTGFKLTLSKKF